MLGWGGGGDAAAWYPTAVDLRSMSLIGAMRRVGWGAGRRLVPYSRRFKFTEPHRRHAAWRRRWGGGRRWGGAQVGGAQVGGGGGEV